MKNNSNRKNDNGLVIGLCIGVGIGTALGVVFDNIAIGGGDRCWFGTGFRYSL